MSFAHVRHLEFREIYLQFYSNFHFKHCVLKRLRFRNLETICVSYRDELLHFLPALTERLQVPPAIRDPPELLVVENGAEKSTIEVLFLSGEQGCSKNENFPRRSALLREDCTNL